MNPHQFQHNHSDVCSACGETYDAEIHGLGEDDERDERMDALLDELLAPSAEATDSGFDEPEDAS